MLKGLESVAAWENLEEKLQDAKLGKVVNCLKRHSDPEVANMASKLVETWKQACQNERKVKAAEKAAAEKAAAEAAAAEAAEAAEAAAAEAAVGEKGEKQEALEDKTAKNQVKEPEEKDNETAESQVKQPEEKEAETVERNLENNATAESHDAPLKDQDQ